MPVALAPCLPSQCRSVFPISALPILGDGLVTPRRKTACLPPTLPTFNHARGSRAVLAKSVPLRIPHLCSPYTRGRTCNTSAEDGLLAAYPSNFQSCPWLSRRACQVSAAPYSPSLLSLY